MFPSNALRLPESERGAMKKRFMKAASWGRQTRVAGLGIIRWFYAGLMSYFVSMISLVWVVFDRRGAGVITGAFMVCLLLLVRSSGKAHTLALRGWW